MRRPSLLPARGCSSCLPVRADLRTAWTCHSGHRSSTDVRYGSGDAPSSAVEPEASGFAAPGFAGSPAPCWDCPIRRTGPAARESRPDRPARAPAPRPTTRLRRRPRPCRRCLCSRPTRRRPRGRHRCCRRPAPSPHHRRPSRHHPRVRRRDRRRRRPTSHRPRVRRPGAGPAATCRACAVVVDVLCRTPRRPDQHGPDHGVKNVSVEPVTITRAGSRIASGIGSSAAAAVARTAAATVPSAIRTPRRAPRRSRSLRRAASWSVSPLRPGGTGQAVAEQRTQGRGRRRRRRVGDRTDSGDHRGGLRLVLRQVPREHRSSQVGLISWSSSNGSWVTPSSTTALRSCVSPPGAATP